MFLRIFLQTAPGTEEAAASERGVVICVDVCVRAYCPARVCVQINSSDIGAQCKCTNSLFLSSSMNGIQLDKLIAGEEVRHDERL